VTGAELVDLAPTILYAVGAPVPRDLDGRVLTEVFTPEFLERQALTFVPSYEGVR
jgi:arylsulfatase A-like enzyme